jgi:hypothetical protein
VQPAGLAALIGTSGSGTVPFGFSVVPGAAAISVPSTVALANDQGASLNIARQLASKWRLHARASGLASIMDAIEDLVPMTDKARLQMVTRSIVFTLPNSRISNSGL